MDPHDDVLVTDPAPDFWALYEQEKDARLARRYQALALLCDLTPVDDVAHIVHVHLNTLFNWIDRYNENGVDGLRPEKSSGRPSTLAPANQEALKCDLCTPPRELGYNVASWDGKAVQHHLEQEFGVNLSRSGTYALMHQLGFRLVVPRPRLAKADEKKERCT